MTNTLTDLDRALRWRRRGLAIALAVAAIVLAAALGGRSVGLLGYSVDNEATAGTTLVRIDDALLRARPERAAADRDLARAGGRGRDWRLKFAARA